MIKQKFNNGWKFKVDDGSAFGALMGAGIQEQEVDLPHDASVGTERQDGSLLCSGNGFFVEQNYVYTKEFMLEESESEKEIWLEFEGVYQNAFVYINGAFAGKCAYGYSNFYIDATRHVQPGKNSLKVVVKNDLASGRWYTGGGIYRDVNLMIADRLHIVPDGVRITVEDVEEDLAKIRVDAEICYTGIGTRNIQLITEFTDTDGKTVADEKSALTVFEGACISCRQELYVKNPMLWDEEEPQLYQYRTYILDTDHDFVTDEEKGTFGIRKLQLDPVHGLRVNGKTVKLRGGCIHHDNGIIGTAEFPHAEEFRIKTMKEAGYNAIRSAHYPMSRRLLEACDKYGMYVMDEFSDVWTSAKVAFDYGTRMSEWWEHDITNMVKKDYNHPCVIMYSIGNEIPEIGNKIDVQWGRKIADKIRQLDSSRYITNGMNLLLAMMDKLQAMMSAGAGAGAGEAATGEAATGEAATGEINSTMNSMGDMMSLLTGSDMTAKVMEEASSQLDITGYNYAAVRYEKDREMYPNRLIVGTETYPKDLDVNWELTEKYPHVLGDFSWTAWDYLGEAGVGKVHYGDEDTGLSFYAPFPCKAAYVGDMNLLGDRRPVSYWRESIWRPQNAPYLCVQPPQHYGEKKNLTQWTMSDAVRSWNFAGCEEKPVVVEVYTGAEEAELFINGSSVGRQTVGKEKKNVAIFDTIYEPGCLEVVVYNGNQECGKDQIKTASKQVHLVASSDEDTIPADGSDICYIDLYAVDENGILNPEQTLEVSYEISGPGRIVGFGSADPDSPENYFDHTAKTFEGRLRAAVRGTGESGKITVIFKENNSEECKVEVCAK